MFILFLIISLTRATIDGKDYAKCQNSYTIESYPFSETFTFDETQHFPGSCGEDNEEQSSIWIALPNTEKESIVYSIESSERLAFHNDCEFECVDILPKSTTITVGAENTYYLVVKGKGEVTISIDLIKKPSKVEKVTTFPYSKQFTTTTISSECSENSYGVIVELEPTSSYKMEVSTCGSTASALIILHTEKECITPEYELCPNGDGIIVSFIPEKMKIEILSGVDGDYSDGMINLNIQSTYCQEAPIFDIETQNEYKGTIHTGLPKESDGCNQEQFTYDLIHLINVQPKKLLLINLDNKEVELRVHFFKSCDMSKCISSVVYQPDQTGHIILDFIDGSESYMKILTQSNEKIGYTLQIQNLEPQPEPEPQPSEGPKEPSEASKESNEDSNTPVEENDELSVGMMVFICIFIVIAIIMVIVGAVCIVIGCIKSKKQGYDSL